MECTFENIFDTSLSNEQKCNIAKGSCKDQQDFLNFFAIFLCSFNGSLVGMVPFVIVVLVLIFKFICALVDAYIAASIEFIVNRFKIGDALAGVTLIALANGAGDVVTAIVASGSSDGVAYNIGALFGAGLFVCSIVMTFTISGSPVKPIVVSQDTIYRDMPFYIISTLYVIALGVYG
jgi:sodium/potassium/calcium exchanger 6